MKFERLTIKDIAKALRIAPSTVSRALNNSHEISIETKEKIKNYANQINYKPNLIAQSLRTGRSRSIGIIVGELDNPFYVQTIDGVESVARKRGYNVIVSQSKDNFENEVSALQYMASRSVDGILLSVSSQTIDYSVITDLHCKRFPIVCFDRIVENLQTHKVVIDNYKAAYEATRYLINLGYNKIAHLACSKLLSITKEQVAGYQDALKDHTICFNVNYLKYSGSGGELFSEVENAMSGFFKLKQKPNAIFTASDKLTINCLRYCKQHRIFVNRDIGMIGFSNLETIDMFSESLALIRQPAFKIGQLAAGQLFKLIENKSIITEFDTKILEAVLVRKS